MEEQEKKIDLIWILLYLWSKWKFILKCVGASLLFFLFLYIVMPKTYKVETSLVPIVEGGASGAGSLKSLASLAGVNLGDQSSAVIITPDLYPKVAESVPFLLNLANVPVYWADRDTIMTSVEYFKTRKKTAGELILDYTIKLPMTIIAKLQKPEEIDSSTLGSTAEASNRLTLTNAEMLAIMHLDELITIEEDAVYETINISVEAESPQKASVIADNVLSQLQKTIIEYKTKRLRSVIEFMEKQLEKSQEEYDSAREAFFRYSDTHRDMVEERVDVEYQQLSDRYDMSYTLLKTYLVELERSKMDLLENTPMFSVVDPIVVPNDKYSPSLKKNIFFGVFFGGFFSVAWLLGLLGWWWMFKPQKAERIIEEIKASRQATASE